MWLLYVLGIIAFLLMEHPVAFWCIFIPLCVLFLLTIVGFLGNKKASISDLLAIILMFGIIVAALVLIASC